MSKPLVLLGEAFGENEVRIGQGFVGSSGIELLRMLNEAGVIELTSEDNAYMSKYYNEYANPVYIDCIWRMHPEVYRTNVFQLHPPGNKIETFCGAKRDGIPGYPALIGSKYVRAEFQSQLDRLGDELLNLDPNLILLLGNTAMWAMLGRSAVSKNRGTTSISTHTVSGYKTLSSYHPAAVVRQWDLRPVTVADLMKAKREALYPELRRPKREIWIEPTLQDIIEFKRLYIDIAKLTAVDIETAGNQITCIGFAVSAHLAIVIPFVDKRKKGFNYWQDKEEEIRVWEIVRDIMEDGSIKKIFQNGMYDVAFTWRSMKIKTRGAEHDDMLLHHALHPESLKSLGYMGSVYTDETSWKSMRKEISTIKSDE